MQAAVSLPARAEWKKGWATVLAAASGMSVTPLIVYTTGIFIEPLEQEFGWSRTAINSGLTVNAVIGVLLSPFAGALIDRHGPRRIALGGIILFGIFFALLATNSGSLVQWWGNWLLLAFACLMLKPTVWVAAVASRFEQARGMAVALTLSGSSISSIGAPLVTGTLLALYGWRTAFVGIAVLWCGVVFPLLFFLFYGATDLNRRRATTKNTQAPPQLEGTAAREAFRSANYIKLALACTFSYLAITGTIVNLMPMLVSEGVPRPEAVILLSIMGGAALAGRLLAGYWLDRHNPKLFGIIVFALPIGAFAMLVGSEVNFLAGVLVVILIGISSGAEYEIAAVLISRYFGLRQFGVLFGTVVGLLALVSGVGPALFGFIHDRFGTYELAQILALTTSSLASLVIMTLTAVPSRATPGSRSPKPLRTRREPQESAE